MRIIFLPIILSSLYAQWSEPIPVTTDTTLDYAPNFIPYNQRTPLWAVWTSESRNPPLYVRQIRASFFAGDSWSPYQPLCDTAPLVGTSSAPPGITIDSTGKMHCAWYYGSHPTLSQPDSWGIYIAVGDSFGWQEPELIFSAETTLLAMASELHLITDREGRPTLIWSVLAGFLGNAICFSRYENNQWQPIQVIVYGIPEYCIYLSPAITASDEPNLVWVAYVARIFYPNSDCYIRVHTYPPISNSTSFDGDDYPYLLNDLRGKIYVFYLQGRALFYATLQNGNWRMPQVIDSNVIDQPTASVDYTGYVWLTYSIRRGNRYGIIVRYNPGNYWSEPETVFSDTSLNLGPRITADFYNRLWVVWNRHFDIYSAYRIERPGITEHQKFTRHSGLTFGFLPDKGKIPEDMEILDATGKKILGSRLFNLPKGIYFIKAKRGNSSIKKIILW